MATSVDYIEYVCEQIRGIGAVRYKKAFGEYIVYVDDKPIFIVCDNIVYIKKLEVLEKIMEEKSADVGKPYTNAKERYILNIDQANFCKEVIDLALPYLAVPKPRKPKKRI